MSDELRAQSWWGFDLDKAMAFPASDGVDVGRYLLEVICTITCSYCGAEPEWLCATDSGNFRDRPHASRLDDFGPPSLRHRATLRPPARCPPS